MSDFNAFPNDLFAFLNDLAANNNREWFNANKERYKQSVLEPMRAFIIAMGERLPNISMNFTADPRSNGGSMFRIYRDVRFSKDKRPYKENVGCQFRHIAGKSAHAPGFYVHLQPDNVFFGGGIWMPPNPVLNKIREAIVSRQAEWEKIIGDDNIHKGLIRLEGERLKRPPSGFDKEHPYIEDIKRKSFFMMHNARPSSPMQSDFIDAVERVFIASSPLMRFITVALGLPF